MKRFLVCAAIAAAMIVPAAAQECDIDLGVYISRECPQISEQTAAYVRNVVNRAISQASGVGNIYDANFGIVVSADPFDQHILAGSPKKYVMNLTVTLKAVNLHDGRIYATWQGDVNGVGNSETKAYNNAFRKISSQDGNLQAFVTKSRDAVLSYYDRNYRAVIAHAKSRAAVKDYDGALVELMAIPACCSGYGEVISEVLTVYQQYVDQSCEENLAMAQTAWMQGFNATNAAAAAKYLGRIYPDASCYKAAQALVKEIKGHMGDEWHFKLKQWDSLVDVQKQKLSNAREIAIALAENRPNQEIHLYPIR